MVFAGPGGSQEATTSLQGLTLLPVPLAEWCRGLWRVREKVSYPRHHGTYQVVLLGALQEQSFVPFVVGEDYFHSLVGFQVDAPEHRPSAIQHFEHFVSLELNVDRRVVCLGPMPLHGWWERAQNSAGKAPTNPKTSFTERQFGSDFITRHILKE